MLALFISGVIAVELITKAGTGGRPWGPRCRFRTAEQALKVVAVPTFQVWNLMHVDLQVDSGRPFSLYDCGRPSKFNLIWCLRMALAIPWLVQK